jgi:DNA polymerase-3 subunit delta
MAVHVLFGDDVYSIGRAVEAERKDGCFDDIDVVRVDGRYMEPQDLLMTVGTPGLFSSRRLVIVQGLGERARGRKPGKKAQDPVEVTVAALAASAPESTTILVLEPNSRSDAPIVKEAKQLAAGSGSNIRVREFAAPKQREMPGWLNRQAHGIGVKLEGPGAQQLALRVGDQVSIAGIELQKLAVAAAPGTTISSALIDELVPRSAEEAIFPLIDAVAAGKRDAALKLLERQLSQTGGSPSDLSIRLIRMLARQFRLLLLIRLLLKDGKKPPQITADLKLPSYFAGQYFKQAHRMSEDQLTAGLEKLVVTEQAIKSGEAREAFLQLLVVDLTARQQPALETSREP